MCGIVGFQSFRHFNTLKDMLPHATLCLNHRGPDSSGTYFDPDAGVGLGHARLSIIDLSSAGHQPMISDDGDVIIIYNGEIFNFIEIRKILEKLGHSFKSATDTEVVLKAYLEWGTGCLEKFIGMFAISIWDRHNHRFFLARDRLGIKPLFWAEVDGGVAFASEIPALLRHTGVRRDLDFEAVRGVLDDHKFITGIRDEIDRTGQKAAELKELLQGL